MSLLETMKEEGRRLRESSGNTKYEKKNWFKPPVGDALIRILPHWSDPKNSPFFHVDKIHFVPKVLKNGAKINLPTKCLEDTAKGCPICAHVIETQLNEPDSPVWRLKASVRFLYNIIDLTKGETLKIWAAPYGIHKDVMMYLDDLNSEFWDLEEGRNWKLTTTKTPKTEYRIRPSSAASAVSNKMKEGLDKMVVLDKVYEENRSDMLAFLGKSSVETDEPSVNVKEELERLEDHEPIQDEKKTDAPLGNEDLERELEKLGI